MDAEMETVDIEARTIDEAIAKACRQFQTTREKLNIEIIAEGNPGFLGFGSKKAHIRAGILQIDQELDHLINGNDQPGHVTDNALHQMQAPPLPLEKQPAVKEEKTSSPTRHGNGRISGPDTADGSHHRKPDKSVRQNHGGKGAEASPSPQGEGPRALELVEGILTRMNIPAQVKIEEEADTVIITITGDGDGLLIGKRGQNLDALQYLVNKAVHRTRNGGKRIVVDTEEYRKRRENTLQSTALQIAQKVRKTHKPMALAPMNPHDRRIIHIALKNEKSLTTKSRGEGEFRKIIIAPVRGGTGEEASDKNGG